MKIQLDFGYMDMEDVIEEDAKCRKFMPRISSQMEELESGVVMVTLTSPYKYELVEYTRRFLGTFGDMAKETVDHCIVKD